MVIFHDLYAERFDPILIQAEIPKGAELAPTIRNQCDEIMLADGILIIHPNWWGQPPVIIKGWIDRVLRPGVAYAFLEGDSGEGIPGLLKVRMAVVLNTSNTPPEREMDIFGDPLIEDTLENVHLGPLWHSEGRTQNVRGYGHKLLVERLVWLEEIRTLIRCSLAFLLLTIYPLKNVFGRSVHPAGLQ